jgi:hypothetical protein
VSRRPANNEIMNVTLSAINDLEGVVDRFRTLHPDERERTAALRDAFREVGGLINERWADILATARKLAGECDELDNEQLRYELDLP